MSAEAYRRAEAAVTALELTGVNREIAEHWLSRWYDDKPPRMSNFRREEILQYVPGQNIFEIRENESVRCIKGAAYVRLAAGFDFTNQDILAITNAADREELIAWMWQIASGAICVYHRSYKSKTQTSGLFQGVALPFSDKGLDGARYIVTHTNWRPMGDDWVEGNVSIDLQLPAERRVISLRQPMPETMTV